MNPFQTAMRLLSHYNMSKSISKSVVFVFDGKRGTTLVLGTLVVLGFDLRETV